MFYELSPDSNLFSLFVCFAVLGVKLKASANSRQALLLSSTLSPVVLYCLLSVFIASMYLLEGRGCHFMCVKVRRQLLVANPPLLQCVWELNLDVRFGGKHLYLLSHHASSVGWLCLR